ncbi:MAG2-interacting protein 2-like [Rhodamnia argentea]|uniref:MAG2-interacting protein 2-like n=1 Tax=Rhodamnia argentea TaxID=178133 RepID=A0ABM3HVV8_9MYRT|nr:MAG2-interacting protein 2-like [Rhodamnia argentea]
MEQLCFLKMRLSHLVRWLREIASENKLDLCLVVIDEGCRDFGHNGFFKDEVEAVDSTLQCIYRCSSTNQWSNMATILSKLPQVQGCLNLECFRDEVYRNIDEHSVEALANMVQALVSFLLMPLVGNEITNFTVERPETYQGLIGQVEHKYEMCRTYIKLLTDSDIFEIMERFFIVNIPNSWKFTGYLSLARMSNPPILRKFHAARDQERFLGCGFGVISEVFSEAESLCSSSLEAEKEMQGLPALYVSILEPILQGLASEVPEFQNLCNLLSSLSKLEGDMESQRRVRRVV